MARVHYLSLVNNTPAEGYWDQAFIADLLDGLPDSERDVFIIPGAYQAHAIRDINMYLAAYNKVLVFITSDEEGKFPAKELSHPDMYIFTQYGTGNNNLPLGYTPQTRPELKKNGLTRKNTRWFFAGQINHNRRKLMKEKLDTMQDGSAFYSNGFAQGMIPQDYFSHMSLAKAVICPPGNVTQDSFRVYETLEAGAVPIADRFSDQGNGDYWDKLFLDAPFPIISSYNELSEAIEKAQSHAFQNKVFSWWIKKKQDLRRNIKELLNINEVMSIVVPTSPIPSHPSTEIIEKTIESIRHHTAMDIFITIDGVRPEQEDIRVIYDEYVRRLLWLCNYKWENVTPVLFEKHVHQSGMMKEVLKMIRTPLLMYVEHDTPLVTDEEIDWIVIVKALMARDSNVVRFHYEAHIPEEHQYLMLHNRNIGDKFTATKQWSQRPHVARTEFYREIMRFFSPEANCFIEDLIYSECVRGNPEDWLVYIYTPGKNIKRSLNLDGRGKDQKFEKEQIW